MIFRRPSDALQTPIQTTFNRASHAPLFLPTPFRRPSHTSPIPPYACALPLGRIAHAKAEAVTVPRSVAGGLGTPVAVATPGGFIADARKEHGPHGFLRSQ